MPIRLLENRIAVRDDPVSNTTGAGIVVVTASNKPTSGVVVAVGPGTWTAKGEFVPTVVKVGDRILYTKDAGESITVDNEQLRAIKEDQVIGVV